MVYAIFVVYNLCWVYNGQGLKRKKLLWNGLQIFGQSGYGVIIFTKILQ